MISEVQIIVNSEEDHFGWLLRKRDSTASGSVDYTSIQGSASFKPRLEVTIDDETTCTATSIKSVSPAIIPSNVTNQTITVTGQSLDRVTSVLVDKAAISYTLVNSTTITFIRNYSSSGTHEISFRSNCLSSPLSNYTLESDTTRYQQAQAFLPQSCDTRSAYSDFSLGDGGKILCWKGLPVRLIGYSGQFWLVTWDDFPNTDNNPNVHTLWNLDDGKDSDKIPAYFKRAQYVSGTGNASRGTNFIRQFAMGQSCIGVGGGPDVCQGERSITETMPFKWENGEYTVRLSTNDFTNLRKRWRVRLKNLIKHADKNGIAVMISLFDENASSGQRWGKNPWNPDYGNVAPTCLPTGNSDSLPDFYRRQNPGGPPDCVHLAQKKYVIAIRKWMQSAELNVCGSGNERCKNVIFEVMNEARLDDSWEDLSSPFTKCDFKAWHDKVAKWINGEQTIFMVGASVKGGGATDECVTGSMQDHCLLQACTQSNCSDVDPPVGSDFVQNFFEVFTDGTGLCTGSNRISLVSLHYQTWGEEDTTQEDVNLCSYDEEAIVFNKPVIFDDDGGIESQANFGRNNNCNVEKWAEGVSDPDGTGPSCDRSKGILHFYHTGDGSEPLTGTAPSACFFDDNDDKIDCQAWNGLADGLPTILCPTSGCATRVSFCENGPGDCNQNCSQ